ncbi:hypothetical protein NEPTK9_001089 [Candidatus Neptunochlamydia vexilliferae]|uniref:DUF2892 domain-containing protein n=1 Tax=Candidatus Neptunichlamydia vexilliferae TaxID=1651774 RepID=A0ABS0B1Y5_9BACT|nr:hypothetical protein [Candidatus Neptunochlamydia vexilliferae]
MGKPTIEQDTKIQSQTYLVIGLANLVGLTLGLTINLWWLTICFILCIGLIVSFIRKICPLCILLAKMPWNR